MSEKKMQEVFAALDMDALDADEQEEVMLTMGELIFRDTLTRCLEAMSSEDRAEFAKLAQGDTTPDDIARFVVAHVPDADLLAGAAFNDLADDILAVTKH